jgi:hypothetical protein
MELFALGTARISHLRADTSASSKNNSYSAQGAYRLSSVLLRAFVVDNLIEDPDLSRFFCSHSWMGSIGIPSESMPTRNHGVVLAVPKAIADAVILCVTLILAIVLRSGLSRADERLNAYLNDMRIMACVTAENAVRARLQDRGRVSFESCASNKFDIDVAADDRDYKVRGYATILSPNVASTTKHFFVRINHDPGSYGDWGFEVTRVEIDP